MRQVDPRKGRTMTDEYPKVIVVEYLVYDAEMDDLYALMQLAVVGAVCAMAGVACATIAWGIGA